MRKIKYKGEFYGCQVVNVDRWYPSSKTCSNCGNVIGGNYPLRYVNIGTRNVDVNMTATSMQHETCRNRLPLGPREVKPGESM